MILYWIISNCLQYALLILFLAVILTPQTRFGSQNYSGWGQAFVMAVLFVMFNIASIHSGIVGCVAYARDALSRAWFWYALVQGLFFPLVSGIIAWKVIK